MNYLASRAKDHIISYGLGDWFDIGPDVPGKFAIDIQWSDSNSNLLLQCRYHAEDCSAF